MQVKKPDVRERHFFFFPLSGKEMNYRTFSSLDKKNLRCVLGNNVLQDVVTNMKTGVLVALNTTKNTA